MAYNLLGKGYSMDQETRNRIAQISQEIETLPKGYVSEKTIRGRVYFYHQWSEGGKTKSVYVPESELSYLLSQIERRRKLKAELNDLKWHGFTAKKPSADLPYLLMHRDTPVVQLSFDEDSGLIKEIGQILQKAHLPIGVATEYGAIDPARLKSWWARRSIPSSRSGILDVLNTLHIDAPTALLRRGYGLSLSDAYWVKPKGSALRYQDINFYDNPFSEDLGELLFTGLHKETANLSSPDSTSVGNLKKRWKIEEGKRVLLKGGTAPLRQEPFNEVAASLICDALGLPHVDYRLIYIDDYPYSVCEDFTSVDVEFVPAEQILSTVSKEANESSYSHLLWAAKRLGIPNVEPFLDKMIVFDYLIANEDRHTNNFGFLRDSHSLSWIGPAPFFDNGSSFGFDKLDEEIQSNENIVCKPFQKTHEKQLQLVSSFAFLDEAKLDGLLPLVKDYYLDNGSRFISKQRADAIGHGLAVRIGRLKRLIGREEK